MHCPFRHKLGLRSEPFRKSSSTSDLKPVLHQSSLEVASDGMAGEVNDARMSGSDCTLVFLTLCIRTSYAQRCSTPHTLLNFIPEAQLAAVIAVMCLRDWFWREWE